MADIELICFQSDHKESMINKLCAILWCWLSMTKGEIVGNFVVIDVKKEMYFRWCQMSTMRDCWNCVVINAKWAWSYYVEVIGQIGIHVKYEVNKKYKILLKLTKIILFEMKKKRVDKWNDEWENIVNNTTPILFRVWTNIAALWKIMKSQIWSFVMKIESCP